MEVLTAAEEEKEERVLCVCPLVCLCRSMFLQAKREYPKEEEEGFKKVYTRSRTEPFLANMCAFYRNSF